MTDLQKSKDDARCRANSGRSGGDFLVDAEVPVNCSDACFRAHFSAGDSVRLLCGEPTRFTIAFSKGRDIAPMAIHKKILDWQATHPNITWIGWGIV
jgi:hypothetical protein